MTITIPPVESLDDTATARRAIGENMTDGLVSRPRRAISDDLLTIMWDMERRRGVSMESRSCTTCSMT